MTKLLKWLLPKKVDIPEIKPIIISEVEPARSPHTALEEKVRAERGRFMEEVVRQEDTARDVRMTLARNTLARHARGLN